MSDTPDLDKAREAIKKGLPWVWGSTVDLIAPFILEQRAEEAERWIEKPYVDTWACTQRELRERAADLRRPRLADAVKSEIERAAALRARGEKS